MTKLRIGKDLEKSTSSGSIIRTDINNEQEYLTPAANGTTLTMVAGKPEWAANINSNENLVIPSTRNTATDFTMPHGTLVHNNVMYVSTRGAAAIGGAIASKLLMYPDCTNLSVFTSITMPVVASINTWNLDSICYDPVTDKIIVPISNTKKVLVANAGNISIFNIVDIVMTDNFGGSPPIVTDGVGNIYTTTANGAATSFVKIETTTFTVVATNPWVGGNTGSHAATIDTVTGVAHFTGILTNKLAIVNLATLSYTEINTGLTIFTDDLMFYPADTLFLNWGNGNIIIAGTEGSASGGLGAVVINLDTLTVTPIQLLPSWGIWLDTANDRLLNTSYLGTIETVPMGIIAGVANGNPGSDVEISLTRYTARGFRPNEIMFTSCGMFCTSYNDTTNYTSDGLGALIKIDLLQVDNPIPTWNVVNYLKQTT